MLLVRVAKDCDDWLELITMPVGVLMTVADHGPCRGSGGNSEFVGLETVVIYNYVKGLQHWDH